MLLGLTRTEPLLEAHHNHKTVVELSLESTTFEVRIDDKKIYHEIVAAGG